MVAVLCLANLSLAQMKTPPQETPESQAKLKKAEQVVIRAMRRFGQTLDFKDVYREFYVKDKTIKENEIKQFIDDIIDDKTLSQINKSSLESLFVKFNNTIFLWVLCSDERNEQCDDEIEIVSKLNKRQRWLFKSFNESNRLKSRLEILEYLNICDIDAGIFRKYISKTFRYEMQSKVTIHNSEKSINFAKNKPYLTKYTNIYEITVNINKEWLTLNFYVVEESNEMRIASIVGID